MANTINSAVSGLERTGIERLKDSGRLAYRAAPQDVKQHDTSMGQALKNFGQAMTGAYGAYSDNRKSKADERSNEIIRKLTPEQRREAVANGTLLYQDDPDAMMAYRFKTGRNAAFEVETEIRNKIGEGGFKTQKELLEYRNQRLADKSKAYAEAVGLDELDEDYQRGFNADIVSRDAAIYDTHAQFLSEQTQKMAQMQTVSDLGSMLNDPGFIRAADAPQQFAGYLTASLQSGSIPTEGMAIAVLQKALADNSTVAGADVFMQAIGDQEVTLYGAPRKVRDIIGPEVLENYQAKAGEATFNRNRELTKEFTFGIDNALANPDPHEGINMLAQMESELYKQQPSDVVTSQAEKLYAARGRLLQQLQADSTNRVKAMDKAVKADNRALLFETKYAQRELGDTVSTDWRTFETDPETTGDFKEEDAANFAMEWLSKIDRMSLPQEERDRLKLRRLRADFAGGPFRKHFETLTDDAVSQFKGLAIAESAEVNEKTTSKIREFMRAYQADTAQGGDGVLASLYPEQAALAEQITSAEAQGLDLAVLVDAERRKKGMNREEQMLQERKWAELFTASNSAVPYLPGGLKNAARSLFDSEVFRTGDESAALAKVNSWLEKSTVSFTSSNGPNEGMAVGAVQKRTLMVDPQDAQSWRAGRELINGMIRKIAEAKPWINEGDITIVETKDGIRLSDSMSSLNLPPITTQILRQEYMLQQQARQAEAEASKAKAADEKINQYQEAQRRKAEGPFRDTSPEMGTLEGAAGFRDR